MWRSRWAAFGAAVAVSLGAGGVLVSQAAPGPDESTIVNVTPERILDTRVDLGLAGPFASTVSQKLQVTGSVPTATGTKVVVPAGATGVLLNVTAVQPTGSGFVSVRPGDATGAPTTSSLNVNAGTNVPNAVQVALPTSGANAGQIDITYDSGGAPGPTTEMLVDVVGYTTNIGLQELVADVQDLGAGFAAQGPGLLTWTANTEQTVVELDLPAGSYLITTKVKANSNASVLRNADCRLRLGATEIDDIGTGVPLTANEGGGSKEVIALTSGGTLAAPGTASLLCVANGSDGNWVDPSMTAVQLQTLEISTSAAASTSGLSED